MSLVAGRGRSPAAFTLVEILVATVLTLLLMVMVVTIFADISNSVSDSREVIELTNRLRSASHSLKGDFEGATAPTVPPRNPDDNEGYLEVIEGPTGPGIAPRAVAIFDPDGDGTGPADTTWGDMDDLVMLTVRSKGAPFVGRFTYKDVVNAGETPDGSDADGDYKWRFRTIESPVAEVAWFVRGTTLYRRVLLVHNYETLPDFDTRNNGSGFTHDRLPPVTGFYWGWDLSVRQVGGAIDRNPYPPEVRLVPNSLGDLTKRENRYGHQPYVYPHDAGFWGLLGLPTLRECSHPDWPFPLNDTTVLPAGAAHVPSNIYTDADSQIVQPSGESGSLVPIDTSVTAEWRVNLSPRTPAATALTPDYWVDPHPYLETDTVTGTLLHYLDGDRIAEDVVMTNVIGFDVKVWDPGAPVLADDTTGELYAPGDPYYLTALASMGSGYSAVDYGAYVDLNYMQTMPDGDSNGIPDYVPPTGAPASHFYYAGFNNPAAPSLHPHGTLPGGTLRPATYDTWSSHYEHDGFNQDQDDDGAGNPVIDEGADGYDNNGISGVDDQAEQEAPPPYPYPLRGIQVRIRAYEARSRQIREVSVVHDFLPN
jgi:type II secretory pathway component PulJ